MKHLLYQFTSITLAMSFNLPALSQNAIPPNKPTNLDVNLGGSPNINFNSVNNNKKTTQLRNFAPGNLSPTQIDLSPVTTPPVTGIVKTIGGAWINTDTVDPDVKNAAEAEALKRKTGKYYAKPIQTVANDQPVDSDDIQDFLKNYYDYLRDVEIPSGTPPVVPNRPKSAKTSKKTSSIENNPGKPTALLAKQQKLIISKAPNTPAPDSH